jgi:hypothetical protein
MNNKVKYLLKYGALGVMGIFILSGCTATSSPGLAETKKYVKEFKVDKNDGVNVVVTNAKGIDIKSEGKVRLAEAIKKDIDILKKYNMDTGKPEQYLVKVHITKYDKGNAFARFMIAGAGQIHVDGVIDVYTLPSKRKVEEFKITKTFAWGGLYGGATTIKEVGEGFAMGVAETITNQKKR